MSVGVAGSQFTGVDLYQIDSSSRKKSAPSGTPSGPGLMST